MAIRFHCQCGQEMTVPDEHAGKRGKCPGCQEIINVPAVSDPPDPPAAHQPSWPQVSSTKTGKPAEAPSRAFQRCVLILASMIATITGTCSGVISAWMFSSAPSSPSPIVIREPLVLPESIEARQFVVRDKAGNPMAILGPVDGGLGLHIAGDGKAGMKLAFAGKEADVPYLELIDKAGKTRVALGVAGIGPQLLMRDATGETHVDISVFQVEDKGAALSSSVLLGPSVSKGSKVQIVGGSGNAEFTLFDEKGNMKRMMSTDR